MGCVSQAECPVGVMVFRGPWPFGSATDKTEWPSPGFPAILPALRPAMVAPLDKASVEGSGQLRLGPWRYSNFQTEAVPAADRD